MDLLGEDPIEEILLEASEDRRPIFRKDRHLSSAIITSEIDYMLEHRANPKALKREHRDLIKHLDEKKATIRDSKDFVPWFMYKWKDFRDSSVHVGELNIALKVAQHALRVSTKDYTEQEYNITIPKDDMLVLLYQVKQSFNNIFKKIVFSTEFHQDYTLGKYKCDAYGNLHLIWVGETTCWLITHSHLTCVRDAVNSWFSVTLYSIVASSKYPSYNFKEEVARVLQAGRDAVSREKMAAYSLLKMWPSLVIASILRDTENKTTLFETLEKETRMFWHTDLYKHATARVCDDIHVQMRLELTGLWKCFGHPNIDMSSSVKSWIKKGGECKTPQDNIDDVITWVYRLEFCRQFYKQHKKWPILEIDNRTPSKIRNNYVGNTWNENPNNPWRPSDFRHLKLLKNLDFDYHIETADLLADKSIIPSLSQWIHEYDKQAHRTLYGYFPTGPPATSKSAIVHYLQTTHINVRKVIETISSGSIPDEWKVAVAVAKEREFKIDNARFYGKMCFEMRLYQTATEKNIADHVFKYIKNQSMTMSEEQLTRTILRMNTPVIQLEGETYVFITLDFSSWCTSFRYELMTPLFEELDSLFGLRHVYSFTHEFPLISYLLFQDRFKPPRQSAKGAPEEGDRCYPYPEAWLEGLRQKGWTLATILLILHSSWTCGTSASLLGQGDNQVILLRIPPAEYLTQRRWTQESYIEHFLIVLRENCMKAGITIKLEETWYSRHLFEYSRKYHYKGIQVSGCCKRVSRLSSEANQTIPSLNGDIAGLFSTGMTAASEDSTPINAYYCTVVEACLLLRQEIPWLKVEPWEFTACLLLVSRVLGGYPITIYSQFCTRAVQDVLSSNLHLIRTVLKDPILEKQMRRAYTLKISTHIDPLSLIKDPQSLPLDIPIQPENYIKKEVKQGLETMIRNVDVMDLFSVNADTERDHLVKDLISIEPCNPRLINKIYALSNIGMQEKWTGMFTGTRSLQQLAFKSWSNERRVLSTVKELERTYSRYLKNRGEDVTWQEIKDLKCISTYTQMLREKAWNIRLEGITMAPQQEQTKIKEWSALTQEETLRSILITEQSNPGLCKFVSRGSNTPYFGSMTRMRARRAPLQVVEVGSYVSSLRQLVELHSWIKGNREMSCFIERLIAEKTSLTMDDLKKYTRNVFSGAISHRLASPALRRGGMANQNLNHSSFYKIVSDTALTFAKSGINYTICFQSVYLSALSILAHLTEFGLIHERNMAVVFDCTSCVWEIPPEHFNMRSVTYNGLLLPIRIEELHHKNVYERYPLTVYIDVTTSYSVLMARKFAAWIVNRRMVERISALENRALEESITLSFVNLSEFSRLSLSIFLNSFVFYCAVYDSTFFEKQYQYYSEVLEGATKNPYDVLLDHLQRCGHFRALRKMLRSPHQVVYTRDEARTLLYNILDKICDDPHKMLTTAYILSPDDYLHTLIRAMQVWLTVNKIPSILRANMSGEELRSALSTTYKDYPSLVPACTLTEDETTVAIRMQPPVRIVDAPGMFVYPFKSENIKILSSPCPVPSNPVLWLIQNDPMLSALAEVVVSSSFIQSVTGRALVTVDDRKGLIYSLVYHCWMLAPGYPHDANNEDWEAEPQAISGDICDVSYNRTDYYRNGPKSHISVYERTLIVHPKRMSVTLNLESNDILYLGFFRGGERPLGRVYNTHAYKDAADCWILYTLKDSETLLPAQRFSDLMSYVTTTSCLAEMAYYLKEQTTIYDICFSPFAQVTSYLGAVPTSLNNLVLVIKSRIRCIIHSWTPVGSLATPTYESVLERHRIDLRKVEMMHQIYRYHLILTIIKRQTWDSTRAQGIVSYHVHKMPNGAYQLCWRRCRVRKFYTVSFDDIKHSFSWYDWIRYCWMISGKSELTISLPKIPKILLL